MPQSFRLFVPLLAWSLVLGALVIPRAAWSQDPAPPRAGDRPTPAGQDTLPGDTIAQDTAGVDLEAEAAAPDSVIDALLQLPGYVPIEYQAQSAQFNADSAVLRLEGEAQVVRAGDRLTADTITYWQDRELVKAVGEPTVSGQQAQEITGNVLWYDLESRSAMVEEGTTTLTSGATWYVRGNVTTEGNSRIYAAESTFTTDDRPEPQYHFQADRIKVIRDRILVGRPARLYFRNVPVFWLPFIVQDLGRGRRSGLLTPEFGLNDIVRTSSGYTREIRNVGFYWAINDYMDAQIAGGWRSDTYKSLDARLQYRWRERFLNGNLYVRRYWRTGGGTDLSLSTSNSWQPDERSNVSVSGNYATSSSIVRDLSIDPQEVTQNLTSTFSFNRRFDWGTVNVGGSRRQSILDDQVEMQLPDVSINLNPITLFRAPRDQARWYNNASFKINGNASRSTLSLPNDSTLRVRGLREEESLDAQVSQSLDVGNFSINSNVAYDREFRPGMDSVSAVLPALSAQEAEDARWQANMSYRIPLIGNTFITPNVGLAQELRRDSLSRTLTNDFVKTPLRFSVGTGITPNLYGFFPGVGPYSAIRHHLRPSISYSYAPAVRHSALQDSVFGMTTSDARNVIQLSLSQTFEAKVREREEPTDTAEVSDTIAASDTTSGETMQAAPAEPEKVQLLGIETSTIGYDFAKAARGESGFIGDRLNNRIRSDFFRGLTFDITHDLFDESDLDRGDPQDRGKLGSFAPHLSRVNFGFSFNERSGLVRWLGGLIGMGGAEVPDTAAVDSADVAMDETGAGRGIVPDAPGAFPGDDSDFGAGPSRFGRSGGGWNVRLNYSLDRPRPVESDDGTPRFGPRESQTIQGNVSFSPTPNWSVDWSTSYSVTEGKFGSHSLRLRRDLYRWEANFIFSRTVTGNTSFSVTVRLIDLPDLKVDYRERDLGGDAGGRIPTGTGQ